MVCNGRSLFGSSDTSGHGPEKLRKIFDASTGAWHLTRGRDLPAFRLGIAKVPGTGRRGEICQRQLVPGTGRGGEICQHFDSGYRKGAWHRARGRDLLAFRFGDRKGAWHRARHRTRGEICQHSDPGIAKVPGTGLEGRDHSPARAQISQRCLARMALYAWGQSASSLAARGSFLLYFLELWQLMMTSKTCLG